MTCKTCGRTLTFEDAFCPNCGAKRGAEPPKKRKKKPKIEYVKLKKSRKVIILAIIFLLIAILGIWYSTTDGARIVGRWKCERWSPELEKNIFVKVDFDLFGGVTENLEGTVIKSKYSINGNQLTVVRPAFNETVVDSYQFQTESMIELNGVREHPLTRLDILPYYLVIFLIALSLGVAGILMLLIRKRVPAPKKEGVAPVKTETVSPKKPAEIPPVTPEVSPTSYTPSTEFDGASDFGSTKPRFTSTMSSRVPTASELFAKAGASRDATDPLVSSDSDAMFGRLRFSGASKPAEETSTETVTPTLEEGSRLRTTFVNTAPPVAETTVPPTDSEHMERAGDL